MIDAVSASLKTIDRLGIPLRVVADCTGIAYGQLWQYFQDKKICPRHHALLIDATVKQLDALAKAVAPFPVHWKAEQISALVEKFRDGTLRVIVLDADADTVSNAMETLEDEIAKRQTEAENCIKPERFKIQFMGLGGLWYDSIEYANDYSAIEADRIIAKQDRIIAKQGGYKYRAVPYSPSKLA